MTEQPNPAELAAKLTATERRVALALCGDDVWEWANKMSPGIALMNSLGLMHIIVVRDNNGDLLWGKAKPTNLGRAVRDYLKGQP